jgi:hypothetical protein
MIGLGHGGGGGGHHGGGHHGGGWPSWGWYSYPSYPVVDVAAVYYPQAVGSPCQFYEKLATQADGTQFCQFPADWVLMAGAAVALALIVRGQNKRKG